MQMWDKKQLQESVHHFKNGRFFNPHSRQSMRKFRHVLLWQLGFYNDGPKLTPAPKEFLYPSRSLIHHSSCSVQWVNHSTFFVQVDGITILTDPIWATRASPIPFVGPKRKIEPGLLLEELPKIDYVLVSHNHYDHLDAKSVKFLLKKNPHVVFFCPLGVKKWLQRKGVEQVVELDWWQSVKIAHPSGCSCSFTSVPAQHFSGRRWVDNNKSLWCGWVGEFEKPGLSKKLYFVGDTGYNAFDFKKIGSYFQGFDLSLIPIGSYVPRRFMSPVHIGPDEAVRIHKEVLSKQSVACHFGTFRLSEEPESRPAYDLYLELEKEAIDHARFRVPQPGIPIYW